MNAGAMRPTLATTEFGAVVAEYRRTLAINLATLGWVAPALIGAVALVVLLALGRMQAVFSGWIRPVLTAGLLPVVWLLGTSLVHVVRNWDLKLSLHRLGMVQSTWQAEHRLPWEQVAEVWLPADREVRLRLIDGSDVVIDGVTWTDEPAQRIAALTLAVMLPAATDTLRRGGRVRFGPIVVSRKALEVRGHVIPWAEAELRPGLHGGMLTIHDRSTSQLVFVSIRDVPNAHVLRAVLPDTDTFE